MRKFKITALISLITLFFPVAAMATNNFIDCSNVSSADYGICKQENRKPADVANSIIKQVAILGGSLAILTIVYAGFMMVSAAGNADKIKQAKNIILYTCIGLAIMIFAGAIVSFFVSRMK